MATTFTPNIENVLRQNNNFMVPLSSSPYQALGTWEKQGGLPSIYNEYVKANNIAGDWVDKTYNVKDPYRSEGLAGDVRHIVGSSMAKDQLQNLLGDYITPGSPLAEKLTYGLGMGKTYAEELDDAFRIGKQTIKAGDWDKIWSGEFLTHPLEDIRANRIGLSIPYGATEWERLNKVPGITSHPRFKIRQQQLMNRRKQDMQQTIREAEKKKIEQEKIKTAQDNWKPTYNPASSHAEARSTGGDYHSGHQSTVGGQTTDWGSESAMIARGGLAQHAPRYANGGLIDFFRYGGFIG